MSAKKVRIELLDESNQPVAGVTVKATGCNELQTAPNGQAFFLVDSEQFSIYADGAEIYSGALSAVDATIVFRKDGSSWKA